MDNTKDIDQIAGALRGARLGVTREMLEALQRGDEYRFAQLCTAIVKLHGALVALHRASEQPRAAGSA